MDGYVALRRDDMCMNDVIDGVMQCSEEQQVHALFVGSSDEYVSFDNFEMVVEDSKFINYNGTYVLIIDEVSVTISDE